MNKDSYEDIINIEHFEPKRHPRMTIYQRAAQFAPFAALTGYDDAVKEAGRIVDTKIEIDEGLKQIINNKLQIILDNIKDKPEVTLTYFTKDKTKDGGSYQTTSGKVCKIDTTNEYILLENKTKVPIEEIIDINSNIIKSAE